MYILYTTTQGAPAAWLFFHALRLSLMLKSGGLGYLRTANMYSSKLVSKTYCHNRGIEKCETTCRSLSKTTSVCLGTCLTHVVVTLSL